MALRRYKLRLSPSDQFVKDDAPGSVPLPQGPGTPGVGLFGEISTTAMTGASVLMQMTVGTVSVQTVPFRLPKGYMYELILDLQLTASVAAPGGSLAAEVSAEDVVTLVRAPLSSFSYAIPAASGARSWQMRMAKVAINALAWPNDQDNVQLRCNAAATTTVQASGSALTIIQYVP